WRRDQPASEVVGPRVVRAADQFAVALAPEQLGATVAAGIEESPHLIVLPPNDNQGYAGDIQCKVVTGLRHLAHMAHVVPTPAENALDLPLIPSGRRVGPMRERLRLLRRKAHLAEALRREQIAFRRHGTFLLRVLSESPFYLSALAASATALASKLLISSISSLVYEAVTS